MIAYKVYGSEISIHALREEGDGQSMRARTTALLFLSTPSVRRATLAGMRLRDLGIISIHALREEGDGHGGASLTDANLFLSTPSVRRATRRSGNCGRRCAYFYPRPP